MLGKVENDEAKLEIWQRKMIKHLENCDCYGEGVRKGWLNIKDILGILKQCGWKDDSVFYVSMKY